MALQSRNLMTVHLKQQAVIVQVGKDLNTMFFIFGDGVGKQYPGGVRKARGDMVGLPQLAYKRFCGLKRAGFFRRSFQRPALHNLPIFRGEKSVLLNQFLHALSHLGPLQFYRRIGFSNIAMGESQFFVGVGDIVIAAMVTRIFAVKMAQIFLPLFAVRVLLEEVIYPYAVVVAVRMFP